MICLCKNLKKVIKEMIKIEEVDEFLNKEDIEVVNTINSTLCAITQLLINKNIITEEELEELQEKYKSFIIQRQKELIIEKMKERNDDLSIK